MSVSALRENEFFTSGHAQCERQEHGGNADVAMGSTRDTFLPRYHDDTANHCQFSDDITISFIYQ